MEHDRRTATRQERERPGHGAFFWVVVPFPVVAFVLCALAFGFIVGSLHYWVGAPLSLVLCTVVAGLLSGVLQRLWIERSENPLPLVTFTTNISALATAVLILLTVGAWVSYALAKVGLAQVSSVPPEPSYGRLVSTYGWHLIDVIPFTNVGKTLGMEKPLVQFKGWVGGAPILVFRLFVVFMILSAVREAWKLFRGRRGQP